MNSLRPAAVAGSFYPADPRELAREISELLDDVETLTPRIAFPKALIVPHAGYVYSGAVAAHAYDALAPARGVVSRVVLLGPAHRVPVSGLAIPSVDRFQGTLGEVTIDRAALRTLADMPQIAVNDVAHAMEHSLEVQLPFLQRMLGDFALVPFAVGAATPQDVAAVLKRLWGGEETLIVVSTDLSHYHPYEQARRIDAATLARIEAMTPDLNHEEACGATPLNGLLIEARRRGMKIERLAASNSGDTAGGRREVVGYASVALYEREAVSIDEAGRTLVTLAREAIASDLGIAPCEERQIPAWLSQRGATFVTLTRAGRLRGCIGSLSPSRSLADDVAANARAAAFRDPRFPPLAPGEWGDLGVEVSLLSDPKPLRFADEEELLAKIVPGEDGIILECDGRRATFLPQVWSELPDTRRFLAELLRKAGLPDDTRLARCRIARYRVLKWGGVPRGAA